MDRDLDGSTNPLVPAELNKLLGNLFITHRGDMGYQDTRRKLARKSKIDRSHSVFTNIHHSFWEVLNEDLKQVPSSMILAANLLTDIKARVIFLLTPTTMKLKEDVEKLLDEETILFNASRGNLRLKAYAVGVLHILDSICTPRRENLIRELLKEKDVLAMYKGIIKITDIMKADMKKYGLVVAQSSHDFEESDETVDKVADFMYHLGGELPVTESWLRKHFVRGSPTKDIVIRAFVSLLASGPEPYPETLMMYIPQLEGLKRDYYQLIIAVSIVLSSLTYLPPVMCTAEAREDCFMMNLNSLTGIKTDAELTRVLPSIVNKIRICAIKKLREINNTSLTESLMQAVSYQISLLSDPENKIRRSVTLRVKEYLTSSLASEGSAPVPQNVQFISRELTELSARLNTVVMSSMEKCMPFYEKIVIELREKSVGKTAKQTNLQKNFNLKFAHKKKVDKIKK